MSVNATAEQEVVSRSMSATAEHGQVNSSPKKVAKPWYKNKRCMIPLIFIIIALLVAVIVGGLAAGGVFDSETKSQGLSEGDSSNVVQLEEDTTTPDPAIAGDSGDSSQSTTSANSDGSTTSSDGTAASDDTTTGSSVAADSDSSTAVAVDGDRFIDGYLPPAKYTADEIAEMRPDWQIFEDLVIPWSEWSALCGDGICGEGEWCRNCPQDCECTFNCGNGVCEDGENGWTCADDCTHITASCGDGVCQEYGTFATNSTNYRIGFETPLICPIDCPLEDSCGDGVCSATESCFTCPSDCGGMCAPVCGDAKCDPTEGCDDCSRDCGACNTILNDGICAWPRETIVNAPNDCKAYIAPGFQFVEYEGVRYATLTGVDPLEETFNDTSCVSIETFIPNGWKMASNNNRTAELLKKYSFTTGCAIVEGGIALASAGELQEYCSNPPLTTKLHGDGRVSVAFSSDYCPSRVLLEAIEDVMTHPDFKAKECPYDCWGNGACDPFSGRCSCNSRWIGSYCERIIGDFRIPEHNKTWYKPKAGITWQWQLQDEIDQSFDVDLYDVDVDTSATVISQLHDAGRKVMCYFSAGSWEEFRMDEAKLAQSIRGGPLDFGEGDVFTDEAWLDLRRMDMFLEVMLERIDLARDKGCDAIEYDNLDMIIHDHNIPGAEFDLKIQLQFNIWLAEQAHARGMAVALKNSNEFNMFLADTFDMVVNEECWINGNCDHYWPFINRDKPVLNCEYFTSLCMYCDRAAKMNFSTIKKNPPLDACLATCSQEYDTSRCEGVNFPDASGSYAAAKYPNLANGWCPMTTNVDAVECENPRFKTCDPAIGY